MRLDDPIADEVFLRHARVERLQPFVVGRHFLIHDELHPTPQHGSSRLPMLSAG